MEAPDGKPEARISQTFAFDARRASNEKFSILARTGMGKTYAGCVMLEEFYANNLQFVAIDPLGGMGGLRWNEDGSPGLEDVVFLGGDANEDEENAQRISESQGKELAAEICEDGRSYILDLSHMLGDAQVSFVADLVERLFFLQRKRKTPIHLMVDEADMFAPQNGTGDEQKRSRNALENIWRRGRTRGFGGTLISQRPAVINKNLLTQTGCMLFGQFTSPQDRDAIGEWVRSTSADEGAWGRLRDSLPNLEKGTFYAWSPGWLCDSPRRIKVRHRYTKDSSATPGMIENKEDEDGIH